MSDRIIILRQGSWNRPEPDDRDDMTPFTSYQEIDDYLYDWRKHHLDDEYCPRMRAVFAFFDEHQPKDTTNDHAE